MRGEVLGVERRRRWSDDEKVSIVSSVGINGATVTQVAQRHDVTRQQVYSWRHDLKKRGLWYPMRSPTPILDQGLEQGLEQGTVFLPIDFHVPETAPPAPVAPSSVELGMVGGRCLQFDSTMDVAVLTRLIRAVEAA